MFVTTLFRGLAVGVVTVFGLFGALFITAESITDPGGWRGIGLAMAWILPMAALVLLALFRPAVAARVLPWALAAAAVVVLVDAGTGLLEGTGPAATVIMFVVVIPCGLLGAHRAAEAGELLIGAAGLQMLALVVEEVRGSDESGPSLADALTGSAGVLVAPLLVCAGLLLLTALLERHSTQHPRLHALH